MRRLENKVALITGGASGLGRSIALRLVREGAVVVITDTRTDLGRATGAEIGAVFLPHDVCDEVQWADVIAQTEERCGSLSILINNAGIVGSTGASNPENTSLADWRRIFAVNVEGVFLGCRAAIGAMRRTGSGCIINIASITGLLATPYAAAYGASKATVRQYTRSVAQHCAEEKLKVRCNSVSPGNIRTPLWDRHAEDVARKRGLTVEDIVAETKARNPLGDFTLPEDVTALVSFLASDEARHITGSEFIVDGGIVNCDTYLNVRRQTLMEQQLAGSSMKS